MQSTKWQDKQGQNRYKTEIVLQGYNAVLQILGNANQEQELHKHSNSWSDNNQPNNHQYDEPPIEYNDDILL